MLKGMLRETLDLPSAKYASCGTTAVKSAPGFAVPDSVHHLKLVSPRKLPLRRTLTCADGWPARTSTVSVAVSILDVPAGAFVGAAATRDAAGGDAAAGDAAAGDGEGAGTGGGDASGSGPVLSGECGAGFAGARIDALESMLGSMFRWLASQ